MLDVGRTHQNTYHSVSRNHAKMEASGVKLHSHSVWCWPTYLGQHGTGCLSGVIKEAREIWDQISDMCTLEGASRMYNGIIINEKQQIWNWVDLLLFKREGLSWHTTIELPNTNVEKKPKFKFVIFHIIRAPWKLGQSSYPSVTVFVHITPYITLLLRFFSSTQ